MLLAMTCSICISGCSSRPTLPPTPNLYLQTGASALESMPPDRQTVDIDLLYATDRKPVEDNGALLTYYDERRSNSLAFGKATVRLGDELTWEELLRLSLDPRSRRIPLQLTHVEELVQFPSSISFPVVLIDGELKDDPEMLAVRHRCDT